MSKLTPSGDGWIYTDLLDFDGTDGYEPIGGMILDADGNLYGMTAFGGEQGTVFSLAPPPTVCHAITCPWTKTVL